MITRAESLAQITGGKAEWYATHRQQTAAERAAGVVWCGESGAHRPAPAPQVVRGEDGTWGYLIHGTSRAGMLTAAECESRGLPRGPGNCT